MAATGMAGSLGTAATACSTGPGSGDVTLKLVAADYGNPKGNNSSKIYWEDLARSFTRRNPGINVDVNVLSWTVIADKVRKMVKSGDVPDIAQFDTYADFADENQLYKVRELLPIPVQADFLAALAEAGEVHRVQYGLPFVSSTRLLFYNKTLFKKAGLDPDSPPKSWDDLKTAARALKSAGVKIPYGLPLGREEAQVETMIWLLGGGGSYVDSVGNYTINTVENVESLTWIRDNLVVPGLTQPHPERTDRAKMFSAFSEGEVGMLNGHPTLMPQAELNKIHYGTGKLPGKNGPSDGNVGVADWMMAFKQNGHREEIGKFLDFVYKERNHYAFADRYDLMPVTSSATDRMRKDPAHRKLWKFLDQLSSAEFYPVGKISWADTSTQIKSSIGQAVVKGGNPSSILGMLQRKAEARERAGSGSTT